MGCLHPQWTLPLYIKVWSSLHLSDHPPLSLGVLLSAILYTEVSISSLKINSLWKWNFSDLSLIGQPYPLKIKLSDLSLIFTVFHILDSKFLFVKQLWRHWKVSNFTRDQHHSSNRQNQLRIIVKMKYTNKNTLDTRITQFNSHVHMKVGYITTP